MSKKTKEKKGGTEGKARREDDRAWSIINEGNGKRGEERRRDNGSVLLNAEEARRSKTPRTGQSGEDRDRARDNDQGFAPKSGKRHPFGNWDRFNFPPEPPP